MVKRNNTSPKVLRRFYRGHGLDPVSAFDALSRDAELVKGAAILESSLVGRDGRFSFIHLSPRWEFRSIGHDVTIFDLNGEKHLRVHPFDYLRQTQKEGAAVADHPLAAYTGGLIGYVGYDSVRLFEDIPDRHRTDEDDPDIIFRRYESAVAFDHLSGDVLVSSVAMDGADEALAQARIDAIIDLLAAHVPHQQSSVDDIPLLNAACDMDDDTFCDVVDQAKTYIQRGDIFQVVLSRRYEMTYTGPSFEVYRAIKQVAPAPYMFYLDLGRRAVVGASPEKLISLQGGQLESCPLAGTRRRGRDAHEDKALAADLLGDEKERAEHMMLVDLARNDVGAIAEPGSVQVRDLMQVENYSHVMHLSSSVVGDLAGDKDAFDALRFALPAGTLSGAPKIRAMELIDQLENSRRGVYGGTICALDHDGNLNSCIVIRTAVLRDGKASLRTGAGIVHQSDPRLEAQETDNKARSMRHAISTAAAAAVGMRRAAS